jgi:hypothetical protein
MVAPEKSLGTTAFKYSSKGFKTPYYRAASQNLTLGLMV